MKKIISIIIILSTLVVFFNISFTIGAEQVSSLGTGYTNVEFSNGYKGFCIDSSKSGAYSGDTFTAANNTGVANNNVSGEDVSQKLKILFVLFFEDIFVSDNNGGYVIDKNKADTSVQSAIWNITDNRYIWGEALTFINAINSYTGPQIADEGHTITLSNSDVIKFSFMVVEPENDSQQSFFAYKIEVVDIPTHQHSFGTKWETDEENHWHECECEEKDSVGKHEGTVADCVTESFCKICNEKLSGVDKDKHTGNTKVLNAKLAEEFEEGYTGDIYCSDCDKLLKKGEPIPATHQHSFGTKWETDEENHWHECECEEKDSVGKHEGTVADCVTESFCKICNEKLSGVNKDKHTGKTDVRNKKEATETQEGYTGDIYCTDCDVILIRGEKIAKSSPPEDQENIPTDTGNDINISMLLAVLFVSALFTVILASIKKTNKG